MAKKKKNVANKATSPKNAVESPETIEQDNVAADATTGIVARNAFAFAFIGAALLVSSLIPAAEVKLDSWSLFQMILGYADLPAAITVAFTERWPLIASCAVIVLCALPLVEEKAGFQLSTRFERTFLVGVALVAVLPAIHTFLFTQSDNVKQVNFVTGYFGYFVSHTAVFFFSTFLMYKRDEAVDHKTKPEELVQAFAFAFLLLITAMVNYQFVNYKLIPKATQILPSIMKK